MLAPCTNLNDLDLLSVCSKAVISILFIHCFCCCSRFTWELCVGSLLCGVVLCVLSNVTIILPRKRELDTLLELCYGCLSSVSLYHGALGWS